MPSAAPSAVDIHIFSRDAGRPLYLLLRQAAEQRFAGQWQLSGGRISTGETAVEAALRILSEETGLHPAGLWALDYLHTYFDPEENSILQVPSFAVEVPDRIVTLSPKHDKLRWITFEQAVELLRFPGQRDGLRRAHEDVVLAPDRGAPFRVMTYA